jgi:hypothetical protein
MELEGSLPCSQEPSTGPCSQPDESNSYHPTQFNFHFNTVTCRGFVRDLYDGFCIGWLDLLRLIHSHTGTTGNYSAIADLHTLQFTVPHTLGFSGFISRILATDLSQSHCNFKSHMKSSLYRLINFLPFLLNHLRLPSPELDSSLKLTLNFWQLTAPSELPVI